MIETKDLTKKYGDFFAIKDINLSLQKGDVFGFIGPNGAGKTTTMRILATLLNPTWGEAYVGGCSIYTKAEEIRHMIGFMPDFFGVYDDMTVLEYLEFFAAAYRIKPPKRRIVCDKVLDLVDLDFKRNEMANTLSRGQTQRLGLGRVLIHDPHVLLLDEPASGLDPRARIKMRELIKKLGTLDKTVIVSSHILPELADICNKVGIIEQGELRHNASVAEVLAEVRKNIILRIAIVGDTNKAKQLLESLEPVVLVELEEEELLVTLKENVSDYSGISKQLIEAGFPLRLFQEEEINLETAFMKLT